jgi:hypothetical protein
MSMENAFRNLMQQLYELGACLGELRRYVVDFGPDREHTALVDLFHDPIDDLLAAQKEALYGAIELHQVVQAGPDVQRLQRLLAGCHARLLALDAAFHERLYAWDAFSALDAFARENGGEGGKWVNTVQAAVTGCQRALNAIHQALLPCWQGLVAQAGKTYISVQAGNNTQIIPARSQALKEAKKSAEQL